MSMVKFKLDPENLPPLTQEEKENLERLAALPDDQIDLSDIPELDEKFWAAAVSNPFYKPKKQSTTVRLDSDVVLWLKGKGKGYQTRINSILRQAMLNDLKH